MQAISVTKSANGLQFRIVEAPDPQPGPGQLLVRTHAAGINFADIKGSAGHFGYFQARGLSTDIAGLEVAGEVTAVGSGVEGWAVGDRVMAHAAQAYAQWVNVEASLAMRVPESLDWVQAAALPIAYLTAFDALVTRGRLQRGGTVLVQAGSSSVGLASIQLAQCLGARAIVATTRSANKHAHLLKLGADAIVNPSDEGAVRQVIDLAGGQGFDVVVDMVGASAIAFNQAAVKVGGTIVQVGRLGGGKGEIDLDAMAGRSITWTGVTFKTRSLDEHAGIVREFERAHRRHLDDSQIRPLVSRVFAFEEVTAAMHAAASALEPGKVVLTFS